MKIKQLSSDKTNNHHQDKGKLGHHDANHTACWFHSCGACGYAGGATCESAGGAAGGFACGSAGGSVGGFGCESAGGSACECACGSACECACGSAGESACGSAGESAGGSDCGSAGGSAYRGNIVAVILITTISITICQVKFFYSIVASFFSIITFCAIIT